MKIIFLFMVTFCMYTQGFSQNVGIGTLSPAGKLHIKGLTNNSQLIIDANSMQSNLNPLIKLRNSSGIDLLWIHADDFRNCFVGLNAGRVNVPNPNISEGTFNTFVGGDSGFSNITGSSNTSIGNSALYSNSSGFNNTASGASALYSNATGDFNTANGAEALNLNTSGYANTANGYLALHSNTVGYGNTAMGFWALSQKDNGTLNTGLGFNSDVSTNGLTNATAIGAQAMVNCSNCMVLGSVNTINGSASSVNVGIGVNNPNARLSISTNGNVLAGSATSNTLTTNAGTLSSMVDSEMSIANIGFMSSNNSSLGIRAYRTSTGTDWYSTTLLLEYDVDNSARVNSSYLALSANGNIGIGTVRPLAKLHVEEKSVLFSAPGFASGMPGPPPLEGTGRRMMWYADKAAFRAGCISGSQWDQNNIGNYSFASGNNTIASGQFSTALGVNTLASSEVSIAFGSGTNATGPYSTAMGNLTQASGSQSTALGFSTHATGETSFATGNGTTASGEKSTAMGHVTLASGIWSTAMGHGTQASGNTSLATGFGSIASADFACAFGSLTNASKASAMAMGNATNASGFSSTAMGEVTTASGNYSTSMGSGTLASGENSTAMGSSTIATGVSSIAMGENTLASGYYSTATGVNTVAGSYYTTAMGSGSQAMGSSSTALGNYTIAKAPGSLSIGILNDDTDSPDEFIPAPTDRLFQIGNGDEDLFTRSNALTVLYNGNMGVGTTTPAFKLSFAPILGDKISLWSNSGNSYGFGVQGSQLQIHTDVIAADIVFGFGSSTSFTENMRIKGNGNVGIGTSSPGQKLSVTGNICATGTIGACSDIRYKTNFSPLDNALHNILQLQGYYYFWKQDEFPDKEFTDKRQIGFTAQELEVLFPELVQTDMEGYKSVDYSRMTPILLEAIKEQQKQIDALQKNDENQQQQIYDLKKLVMELAAKK